MRALALIVLVACGGGQSAAPAPAPVVANAAPAAESPPPAATEAPRRPNEPACELRGSIPCALDWLDYYADLACACTDRACSDDVQERMMAWLSAADEGMKDAKPTKMEDERADKVMDRMGSCMEKFESHD
jgi:hypothetical protein